MTTVDGTARTRTAAAIDGRRADTARRRERVLTALNAALAAGKEISVAGVASQAGVDRTFLYRHRDLLERVHAMETHPPTPPAGGPTASRASLQADLLAAHERAGRLAARVQQLERRLSEILGEQAWRESGLDAPDDVHQLEHGIVALQQQTVDLRLQLDEREQDLAAARAANRELITRLNAPPNAR